MVDEERCLSSISCRNERTTETSKVMWIGSFLSSYTCRYNCVIEKGFSEGEKRDFPILTSKSRHSTSEISKENLICVLKMNGGLMGLERHEGNDK